MREIFPQDNNLLLRQKAKTLSRDDIESEHTRELIRDMKELLANEEHGVALAAPQVGESVRLFIVSGRAIARDSRSAVDEEPPHDDASEPVQKLPKLPDQVYINPEFIKVSRKRTCKHEGCLSIRGVWGIVLRAEKATIKAYDEEGRAFTRGSSGFLAHVFQHEMDHLDGILYVDKAVELYDDESDGHR